MDGLWSSPDLPALLRLAALNRETLALNRWIQLPLRLPQLVAHRAGRNTLRQSRANIRATTTWATSSIDCSWTSR